MVGRLRRASVHGVAKQGHPADRSAVLVVGGTRQNAPWALAGRPGGLRAAFVRPVQANISPSWRRPSLPGAVALITGSVSVPRVELRLVRNALADWFFNWPPGRLGGSALTRSRYRRRPRCVRDGPHLNASPRPGRGQSRVRGARCHRLSSVEHMRRLPDVLSHVDDVEHHRNNHVGRRGDLFHEVQLRLGAIDERDSASLSTPTKITIAVTASESSGPAMPRGPGSRTRPAVLPLCTTKESQLSLTADHRCRKTWD